MASSQGIRLRRRDFLSASALAALPVSATPRRQMSCIYLMLVGGPSQLDTWDPKPEAPSDVRGPYRAIRTNVPGIRISEIFPRMARHADKYAILRAMHHTAAPIHDTGHQLMQTGRLFHGSQEHPHAGCVIAKHAGSRHILLPHAIGATGGNLPHGQTAGTLGPDHEPVLLRPDASLAAEPAALRDAYGRNRFGQSCLMARRLVESGTRFVTVNMFETVFDEITWDIHGARPFSPMSAYRDIVGPMFDMAYSTLLDDLAARGLLETTLIIAAGEFGRTPRINACGGRDHWPNCWSVLVAGGGVRGGQIIGASDALGAEPHDRPTTPAEIIATIYSAFGIPPAGLVDAAPIRELFA